MKLGGWWRLWIALSAVYGVVVMPSGGKRSAMSHIIRPMRTNLAKRRRAFCTGMFSAKEVGQLRPTLRRPTNARAHPHKHINPATAGFFINTLESAMANDMCRRMLYKMFHIDTQLINSRGKLEAMNLIEKWAMNEVILVNMSGVSFKEAQADEDLARTKKALSHIFTLTDCDTNDPLYKKIEAALFPNGAQNDNQRNDAKIVFEAAKYGAYLITDDGASKSQPGGILGNRDKLKGLVNILSSKEAVDFIRAEIKARDEFNTRYVKEIGGELPEWTGKDNL